MRNRHHVLLVAVACCTVLLSSQIILFFQVSLGSISQTQVQWQAELATHEEKTRSSDNSSSTDAKSAVPIEISLNQQPHGYPWSASYVDQQQRRLDFSLLWERVYQPDLLAPPNRGPPLYLIRDGKLYLWKNHFNRVKDFRVSYYQNLIINGLNLVHHLRTHNKTIIDPRIIELVTQPLPFFVDYGDFRKCWDKTYPIFTFATFATTNEQTVVDGEVQQCIPLGIPGYYDSPPSRPIAGNTSWDSIFHQQNQDYGWDTKIHEAIWRGSTTGAKYAYLDWRDLPRVHLVEYSLRNTTKNINAGFSNIVQRNPEQTKEIKKTGLLKKSIPKRDFSKYKAIVDIDGNSWSSRFASLLCMNSIVLKVQPQWVDYFHSELLPFVHYLPVNKNLSNLQDMVNLAIDESMSPRMQAIVTNANLWCKQKFTGLQVTADMVWVIISYIELLKNENISSGNFTKWKAVMNGKSESWNSKKDWHKVMLSTL